jgi:hypothetical protein
MSETRSRRCHLRRVAQPSQTGPIEHIGQFDGVASKVPALVRESARVGGLEFAAKPAARSVAFDASVDQSYVWWS